MVKRLEGQLKVNSLVRHEGRIWLVAMVNDARARIQPISGATTASPVTGKSFKVFGNPIDVAPNSFLSEVDPSELTDIERIRYERIKQEVAMAVAAPPGVEGKTNKQLNEDRKAKLAADKAAKAAAPKAAKEPRVKKEKTQSPCKCGCGNLTGGFFYPGHDARFKGWLLQVERGMKKVEELPESVRKAYKWAKTPDAKGYYPTTKYNGEPNKPADA